MPEVPYRHLLSIAFVFAFLTKPFAAGATEPIASNGRTTLHFDQEWRFFGGDVQGAEIPDFDDSGWRLLDLPHDWSIEGAPSKDKPSGTRGGFFPLGIGWYRKEFTLHPGARNRQVWIQFDGIQKNSDVWINGHHLGNRWYGYVSFQYDLTPHLNMDGPNLLAVRVDNSEQTSRWYTGSGIYRHVWLTVTDPLHIKQWGTYITTPEVSNDSAQIRVRTEIENERSRETSCRLQTEILSPTGKSVAAISTEILLQTGQNHVLTQDFVIGDPELWSVESPALYSARTTIWHADEIIDSTETDFGIRSIKWDPKYGLLVNGKPETMNGVCLHHDLGCLGAAFVDRAMERRLEILKAMGCNAIRTAHNPPAPQLLDMCDRMGFLVIDEAFDKWSGQYYPHFERDWEKDLGSMIRRDWNHPSVVLWSVGNEVGEQGSDKGRKILNMLTDFAHELDPSRMVTCGAFPKLSFDFVQATDIIGLNYQEQWFDQYRKTMPDGLIISTEAYPYYSGKGDSHKSFNPINPYLKILEAPAYVGSFVWTGIDYLGEAVAGWPYHGWNCSLIDTCGFQRPVSFFHESVWSDEPMVRIAIEHDAVNAPEPVKDHWGWPKMISHWTLPALEGQELKIVTYTNCEAVELMVNGRSLGEQRLTDYEDRMITWKTAYAPGTITAIGKKDGRELCRYELQTAGEPARIALLPDRTRIKADGRDLVHFEVGILDGQGNLVPDASRLLTFEVSGPGSIAGHDNGDITSREPFLGNKRKTFHGKALLIVQSQRQPGIITVTVASPGLSSARAVVLCGMD